MAESFWREPYSFIEIPKNTVLSQTITPLFGHKFQYLRLAFKGITAETKLHIKLRYTDINELPIGLPLLEWTYSQPDRTYPSPDRVHRFDSWGIRVVEGIVYALTIETLDCHPRHIPSTRFIAPPGGYPRGKLIKSVDSEGSWDTTDLGDLLFNEWGYPPVEYTEYTPPPDLWALTGWWCLNYNTNACIRVGTSTPGTLTLLLTDEEPTAIEGYRITRGTPVLCLDHYVFNVKRTYPQLEKNDSIYHTFKLHKLKEGEKYWYAFTGFVDFTDIPSTGPIFERTHPGGPPFSTIRRPDAPGLQCQIPYEIGDPCPDHYKNVNEATPDEDATQIWVHFPWARVWRRDLYNIPDIGPFVRPIEQVHLTGRIKYEGGYAYAARFRLHIYTHGTIYKKEIHIGILPTWKNFHWHIYLNPFTGLPWTAQEINDLQIGVGLYLYSGVGWWTLTKCTQVYCKIIHQCTAYE